MYIIGLCINPLNTKVSNKNVIETYKIKKIKIPTFDTNRGIFLRIGLLLPAYLRGGVDVIRNAFRVRAK
jgi:hypothetical protein